MRMESSIRKKKETVETNRNDQDDFQAVCNGNNLDKFHFHRDGNQGKRPWLLGVEMGGGNDHYPYGDNIVPFPPAVSLRGKVVVRQLTHDDSFPASQ